MSVIIKGMEMPESCYYCPFSEGEWGYAPQHRKWCLIDGKDMPVDKMSVQSNRYDCPLVELPPHGRLIDENDVLPHLRSECWGAVKGAKTIIEEESKP